jgi:hypothetical protein
VKQIYRFLRPKRKREKLKYLVNLQVSGVNLWANNKVIDRTMNLQLVHVGKAAKKENKGREEETVISFFLNT